VGIETKLKTSVMAVALATIPFAAHAAGMGRLNVLSGLGQPLHAEIDLVAVQPAEAESLRAALAAPEAFRDAQIDYPSTSLGLRFNLEKRANGQYFIAVNSAGSINEPFLDFLVELKWDGGRVLREYTALLDPVGYNPGGGNSAIAVPPAPQRAPSAKPIPTPAPMPKAVEPAVSKQPAATPAPAPAPSEAADSYTVKPGDTLAAIARKHKPDGVSLEQMLVALYQANQDAFDGNMNRLKRGKILKVPGKDEVGVDQHAAVQEIHAQAEDWRAYRAKLAESTGQSQRPAGADAGSGKITAKVDDKSTARQPAPADKLTLSKGDESGKLKERVRSLEEDTTAKQKALNDANQRVSELEQTNKKLQDLLALKNKQGAALQKQAEQAKPAEAPKVEPKPVEVPAAKPVAPETKAVAEVTPAAKPEVKPVEAPAVAPAPKPVKPKVKKPVFVAPPPEPEPSLLDNPLVTYGGGLLGLLGVGALGAWAVRRRKKSSFEDSIITGSDLKSNTMVGNTGGAVISTGVTENSFLTDFSRAGLGTIDTDEVDPIAEAEVYMAYGRDAQAEEILKDALARDGSRQEVRLKLLEIYNARKNVPAFENLAQEMYAGTQGQGALWQQAAEMGRVLDPQNSLYQHQEPVNTDALDQTMILSAGTLGDTGKFDEPLLSTAMEPAPGDMAGDLDFQLDMAQPEEAAMSTSNTLDFDLGVDPAPASSALDAPVPDMEMPSEAATASETAAAMDMDFDLGDLVDAEPAQVETMAAAPADDGMLSLDIPLDIGGDAASAVHETPMLDMPTLDHDAAAGMSGLDLDLPIDEPAAVPAISPEIAMTELDSPDLAAGLDFDFDAAEHAEASTGNMAPDLNMDAVSLDLDIAPEASSGEVMDFGSELDDPVTTKIDLARAYIDMGDKEGAREILQEALAEGNTEQKATAESLLGQL
jgi:pilus assembly protein FimV